MDDPSTGKGELRRGPLHTSESVPSHGRRCAVFPRRQERPPAGPLHTSGSVPSQAARGDSSSGVRSGIRRGPLQSGGSAAAQGSLGTDSSSSRSSVWLGPRHAPESVAEVGVRQPVLEDLALKILYTSGPLSLRELAAQTRLSFGVVNELLRRMRARSAVRSHGNDWKYSSDRHHFARQIASIGIVVREPIHGSGSGFFGELQTTGSRTKRPPFGCTST